MGCGSRFTPDDTGTTSHCTTCHADYQAGFETDRADRRREQEPWRALYTTTAWRRARTVRKALDRNQCVDCGQRTMITVDHEIPLRILWTQTTDWHEFVTAATNTSHLRTRCPRCHRKAEQARA